MDYPVKYISALETEKLESKDLLPSLVLNAWTVQNIAYELLVNHFSTNDPEAQGYKFKQKYSKNELESEIFLDLGYNWDAKVVQKRPAVFVIRDDIVSLQMVMNNTIGHRVMESEKNKVVLNQMNMTVYVVGTNVGFCEQLAEYTKQPFLHFQEQIQRDFSFRRFRYTRTGRPQLYKEAKENFIVPLYLESVFDEGWIVKGDDLKIKTISKTIFDNVLSKPLENQ